MAKHLWRHHCSPATDYPGNKDGGDDSDDGQGEWRKEGGHLSSGIERVPSYQCEKTGTPSDKNTFSSGFARTSDMGNNPND